jgi:hypothetical protein
MTPRMPAQRPPSAYAIDGGAAPPSSIDGSKSEPTSVRSALTARPERTASRRCAGARYDQVDVSSTHDRPTPCSDQCRLRESFVGRPKAAEDVFALGKEVRCHSKAPRVAMRDADRHRRSHIFDLSLGCASSP